MADSGIKKITIGSRDLPPPICDDSTLYYHLRYRILSEDKNRSSHWSNLQRVYVNTTQEEVGWDPNNPLTSSIPNTLTIDKANHNISLSWTMPSLLVGSPSQEELIVQQRESLIQSFDIYVQWRTGNTVAGESSWVSLGTTTGTNYRMSYLSTISYDHVRFRVQKVTQNKQISNAATYAITDWHSV
jgi:hypothetical protein